MVFQKAEWCNILNIDIISVFTIKLGQEIQITLKIFASHLFLVRGPGSENMEVGVIFANKF